MERLIAPVHLFKLIFVIVYVDLINVQVGSFNFVPIYLGLSILT
jgi:hypothetical protein